MTDAVIAMNRAKANGANKGGAESKVTPELLEKARAFVAGEWEQYNKTIPTVEALALHLGLYRSYVYAVEELSDTREWIAKTQASKLIEHGLNGEYNPGIVKLLLSSRHGYIEKTQTDITSGGEAIASSASVDVAIGFAEFTKQQTIEGEIVAPLSLEANTEATD